MQSYLEVVGGKIEFERLPQIFANVIQQSKLNDEYGIISWNGIHVNSPFFYLLTHKETEES